jgi:hypothetical protein
MNTKWLIFTGVCVASLIALGIQAVDERDVVWEARDVSCPYCRSELPYYAMACKQCQRTLDWTATQEDCAWCLDRETVALLTESYERVRTHAGSHPGELAAWTPAFYREMDAGDCGFCAGIGQIGSAEEKKACPICRGGRDCISCDGSRSVIVGDVRADRRLLRHRSIREQAERRAELTGIPADNDALLNDEVFALQGYVEVETLSGPNGRLVQSALDRAVEALTAVRRLATRIEPPSEDPSGS